MRRVTCSLLLALPLLVHGLATSAQAGLSDLRITEVDPANGMVEVTHVASSTHTTGTALPFCHRLDYSSSIPPGTTFGPGESRVFDVSGLRSDDSDLWLYRDSNFGSTSSILTGLKWGPAPDIGRMVVAHDAGIWPSTSAFVPAPGAGETLRLQHMDPGRPEHWTAGPANIGAFFGTGEAIDDPIAETIPKGDVTIELETVLTGLAAPLGLVPAEDGTDRLFVYDQAGTVVLIENGVRQTGFFLDVRNRLVTLGVNGPDSFDERGLLGFALHPDFGTNRKVYTYTSEPVAGAADFTTALPPPAGRTFDHQSVIAEWTVDSSTGRVDPASRREILRVDQPQFNHNAGTLRFGPEGLLYAAFGDGGGGDDEDDTEFFGAPMFGHGPTGNGQNHDTVHGSLIRIDVDGRTSSNGQYAVPATNPFVGVPGTDEMWAYGLRNPFSFSFDRTTGELWIGDVGQNDIEEIDLVQRGDNLGWRMKEGSFFFSPNGTFAGSVVGVPDAVPTGTFVDPVAEYDHDDGTAVIGGFVYRGTGVPALAGRYVTGDFGGFAAPTGRLFYLGQSGLREFRIGATDRPLGLWLKGFGQDTAGEVYVLGSTALGPFGTSGVVLRIVSADTPRPEGPKVKKTTPSSFRPGETHTVTVKGKHFANVLDVSFGDGVIVRSVTPNSSGKKLEVVIEVSCEAVVGPRDVTVTTAAGTATRREAARLKEPRSPKLKKLSTRRGAGGQTLLGVILTGKRFVDCDLAVTFADPALTAENVVVADDGRSITFDLVIGDGAMPGKTDVTVTMGGESRTKRRAFRVE